MSYHLDIAKERFLDLVADGVQSDKAAANAISDANAFASAYGKWERSSIKPASAPPATVPPMRGCRACYGSGGKRSNPCKACGGSGKVRAG